MFVEVGLVINFKILVIPFVLGSCEHCISLPVRRKLHLLPVGPLALPESCVCARSSLCPFAHVELIILLCYGNCSSLLYISKG